MRQSQVGVRLIVAVIMVACALPRDSAAAEADSLSGRPVECTDFRSGEKISVLAQHILPSGLVDPAWNPATGKICVGTAAEVSSVRVPDGDGGVIVVWIDTALEEGDVYAQHLSANGAVVAGWPARGLAVCTAPGSQYALAASSDNLGGVIVAWMDFREHGRSQVRLQRVSGAGGVLWSEGGVLAAPDSVDQLMPTICADGVGGAVAAWVAQRGELSELRSVRLDSFGRADTTISGAGLLVRGSAEPSRNPQLVRRPAGSWLSWQDGPDSSAIIRLMPLGPLADPEPSWSAQGLAISSHASSEHVALADTAGGLIVIWTEGPVGARDIRAQRVSAAGSIIWGTGGRVICDADGDQGAISAVDDSHGGVLVAWEDYRSGGEADIRAQHLAADGVIVWGAQGAAVIVASGHQFSPVIAHDGSGGALVTWVDGPSSARASFLRARPVRGDDVPRLLTAKAAPGRAQITWQTWPGDARSLTLLRRDEASDWHAVSTQRPDEKGLLQIEERGLQPGTRAAFRLAGLAERPATYYEEVALDIPVPKPFAFRSASMMRAGSGIRLLFTLEVEEPVAFEVFDVQGRRIESQSLDTEGPGDYALEVSLTRKIPPGLFFVRLNHGRVSRTVRMVVTR